MLQVKTCIFDITYLLVASHSGVVDFALQFSFLQETGEALANGKDRGYFNVILEVPPRLSKIACWESPCCW